MLFFSDLNGLRTTGKDKIILYACCSYINLIQLGLKKVLFFSDLNGANNAEKLNDRTSSVLDYKSIISLCKSPSGRGQARLLLLYMTARC